MKTYYGFSILETRLLSMVSIHYMFSSSFKPQIMVNPAADQINPKNASGMENLPLIAWGILLFPNTVEQICWCTFDPRERLTWYLTLTGLTLRAGRTSAAEAPTAGNKPQDSPPTHNPLIMLRFDSHIIIWSQVFATRLPFYRLPGEITFYKDYKDTLFPFSSFKKKKILRQKNNMTWLRPVM